MHGYEEEQLFVEQVITSGIYFCTSTNKEQDCYTILQYYYGNKTIMLRKHTDPACVKKLQCSWELNPNNHVSIIHIFIRNVKNSTKIPLVFLKTKKFEERMASKKVKKDKLVYTS